MSVIDKRVLIFGVHRTVAWWRYLGQNLAWGGCVIVTDMRGEGDISIVDDFYGELSRLKRKASPSSSLLSDREVDDVISRCRTLRWLDRKLAVAMTLAMAIVLDRVLDQVRPCAVLSFPIDRYVKDVLGRMATLRQIPYLELTTSVLPGMSMLLRRGKLMQLVDPPSAELTQCKAEELAKPGFVPSYVPQKSKFTKIRFARTLGYFRARAIALRAKSLIERDPLNIHYLDSQPFLGHKCRWSDIRILDMCDPNWRETMIKVPVGKRILFGLQLFPEASIDYWIANQDMIDHESIVIAAATAFSKAGFVVLVKDHPLQFGFRQTQLLDRLLELPNVVLVPYDVSAEELLSVSGANFTCTGTLGLQAAMRGLKSVVTDSYYTNDDDFIIFRDRRDIVGLPERVLTESRDCPDKLGSRQRNIVSHLLRGSFEGDFLSFRSFDADRPTPKATALARSLGVHLSRLAEQGVMVPQRQSN